MKRFMGQICKCKHFCGLSASHPFTNFINEHISGGATPVLIHLFMSQLNYIFRRWPRLLRKCLFFIRFQLFQRLNTLKQLCNFYWEKVCNEYIVTFCCKLICTIRTEKFINVTQNKSIWFSQFHHKIKHIVWSVNNFAAWNLPLRDLFTKWYQTQKFW